ncbi:MAG: O-succinylhomoserine sulfhydrylase [Azospirillaceae bacterium]
MASRKLDPTGLHPETLLVRGGQERSPFNETSEALYLTQGYVYDSAEHAEAAFKGDISVYIYSRYANPTVSVYEERLAALEGAEIARATSTGMAAVFASLACQVRAGDRVVAARALFGSCHYIISDILPRWGVETVFVDGTDLDAWARALDRPTRAVFLESPSNPMLDLVDIAAVSEMAHAVGARVIVDNVFATPLQQRPLALGADIVVYSTTKHVDGQGRCLGGAILTDKQFIDDHFTAFYRHTGPSLSPFNAWVLTKGLETMPVRVARQCESALAIAEFLEDHPKISLVRYPGLASHPQKALAERQMSGASTLVAFEVKGGKAGAFAALNGLRLIDISNNLGDAKSLVTHPATTTHQRLKPEERAQLGITDGVIRLSVGLEHVDDLIGDLDRALAKV